SETDDKPVKNGSDKMEHFAFNEGEFISRLKKAGENPNLQEIQLKEFTSAYLRFFNNIKKVAPTIKTERGFALMLDLAYQHGPANAIKLVERALKEDTSQLTENQLLLRVAELSIERAKFAYNNFSAAIKLRRQTFLTTPYFSDTELGF
ncbi:MAG TPA: hypothetical protein VM871_03920, partial [Flavisolibacter sp.]|nr:hypothetical protein [Flavisolibacter sp.]